MEGLNLEDLLLVERGGELSFNRRKREKRKNSAVDDKFLTNEERTEVQRRLSLLQQKRENGEDTEEALEENDDLPLNKTECEQLIMRRPIQLNRLELLERAFDEIKDEDVPNTAPLKSCIVQCMPDARVDMVRYFGDGTKSFRITEETLRHRFVTKKEYFKFWMWQSSLQIKYKKFASLLSMKTTSKLCKKTDAELEELAKLAFERVSPIKLSKENWTKGIAGPNAEAQEESPVDDEKKNDGDDGDGDGEDELDDDLWLQALKKKLMEGEDENASIWWPSVVTQYIMCRETSLRGWYEGNEKGEYLLLMKKRGLKTEDASKLSTAYVDATCSDPLVQSPEQNFSFYAGQLDSRNRRIERLLEHKDIQAVLDQWWALVHPKPTKSQQATLVHLVGAKNSKKLVNILSRKATLEKRTAAIYGVKKTPKRLGSSTIWDHHDGRDGVQTSSRSKFSTTRGKRREEDIDDDDTKGEQTLTTSQLEMARKYQDLAVQREERKRLRRSFLDGNISFDPEILCSVGNPFDRSEGTKINEERIFERQETARKLQELEDKVKGIEKPSEEFLSLDAFVEIDEAIFCCLIGHDEQKEATAQQQAVEDFERIRAQFGLHGPFLPRSVWQRTMLELVDLWTNTACLDEYLTFLQELLQMVDSNNLFIGLKRSKQILRSREVAEIIPGAHKYTRIDFPDEPDLHSYTYPRWPKTLGTPYLRSQAWSLPSRKPFQETARIPIRGRDSPGPAFYSPSLKYITTQNKVLADNSQCLINQSTSFVHGYRVGQIKAALSSNENSAAFAPSENTFPPAIELSPPQKQISQTAKSRFKLERDLERQTLRKGFSLPRPKTAPLACSKRPIQQYMDSTSRKISHGAIKELRYSLGTT